VTQGYVIAVTYRSNGGDVTEGLAFDLSPFYLNDISYVNKGNVTKLFNVTLKCYVKLA